MHPRALFAYVALLLSGLIRCLAVEPTSEEAKLVLAAYSGPVFTGVLSNPGLDEASGLAVSRRAQNLLWSHNDSDAGPVLYALGFDGRHRGSVRVHGAKNVDWEAVRSFSREGRSWLLIGDVGFDDGKRTRFSIIAVPEPDPASLSPDRESAVEVAWSYEFEYADRMARDCESVAVDVGEGLIYLLEKRVYPCGLYTLPLRPRGNGVQLAALVCTVDTLPQPDPELARIKSVKASWRANPTDMDFAADGSAAVVATYASAYLFPRRPGESWMDALTRPPERLPSFHLESAEIEGICFAGDNRTIFMTGEKPPAPVLRYDPRPH
ncbi:MAG: hypothetical protein KAX37_07065 [Opitutaceae bacterium]|nr:hypothetical protein [Opitutaceae bacterium]